MSLIYKVCVHKSMNTLSCNNNNNNLLHLYSAFLGTQSTLNRRGVSPQPPPVCSIHLDDATAAILRQNAHHTPAYWWCHTLDGEHWRVSLFNQTEGNLNR